MWFIEKNKIPKEIANLIDNIFEIYEARAKVGESGNIVFIIYSNEGKHHNPHVHIQYNEYEASIEISNEAKVLVGKLPTKKLAEAREWVRNNSYKLLNEWSKIVVNTTSRFTISGLNLRK